MHVHTYIRTYVLGLCLLCFQNCFGEMLQNFAYYAQIMLHMLSQYFPQIQHFLSLKSQNNDS